MPEMGKVVEDCFLDLLKAVIVDRSLWKNQTWVEHCIKCIGLFCWKVLVAVVRKVDLDKDKNQEKRCISFSPTGEDLEQGCPPLSVCGGGPAQLQLALQIESNLNSQDNSINDLDGGTPLQIARGPQHPPAPVVVYSRVKVLKCGVGGGKVSSSSSSYDCEYETKARVVVNLYDDHHQPHLCQIRIVARFQDGRLLDYVARLDFQDQSFPTTNRTHRPWDPGAITINNNIRSFITAYTHHKLNPALDAKLLGLNDGKRRGDVKKKRESKSRIIIRALDKNVGNRLSRLLKSEVKGWSSSKVRAYLNGQAAALVKALKKCRQAKTSAELRDAIRRFIKSHQSTPQLLLLNWFVLANSLSVTLVMRDRERGRLPEKLKMLLTLVDFGNSPFECDQWVVALMIEEPFFFEIARVCDHFLHALKWKCRTKNEDQPTETNGTPDGNPTAETGVDSSLSWKGLAAAEFSEFLLFCRISAEFDRLLQVVCRSCYRDYFIKKCPWFLTHLRHWVLETSSAQDRVEIPELGKAMLEHEKLIQLVVGLNEPLLPADLHARLLMILLAQHLQTKNKIFFPSQSHHHQVDGFTVDLEPSWIWSSDGSNAMQVDLWWNVAKVLLCIWQITSFNPTSGRDLTAKELRILLIDSNTTLDPDWLKIYPLPPISGTGWLFSVNQAKLSEFQHKMEVRDDEMFQIQPVTTIKEFFMSYDPTLNTEKLIEDGFNSWVTIMYLTTELCDTQYR